MSEITLTQNNILSALEQQKKSDKNAKIFLINKDKGVDELLKKLPGLNKDHSNYNKARKKKKIKPIKSKNASPYASNNPKYEA